MFFKIINFNAKQNVVMVIYLIITASLKDVMMEIYQMVMDATHFVQLRKTFTVKVQLLQLFQFVALFFIQSFPFMKL